jgi:hypothetical protein
MIKCDSYAYIGRRFQAKETASSEAQAKEMASSEAT